CLRDPADHAPDERALALRVDPGVEVVRDEREAEADLFRAARVLDELAGRMLLGGERVAVLHGVSVPNRAGCKTPAVSAQTASLVQALLEGVALPASKHELIDYAREQGRGGSDAAGVL